MAVASGFAWVGAHGRNLRPDSVWPGESGDEEGKAQVRDRGRVEEGGVEQHKEEVGEENGELEHEAEELALEALLLVLAGSHEGDNDEVQLFE